MTRKTILPSKTNLTKTVWLIITIISGGGITTYINSHWPILGAVLQQVEANRDHAPAGQGFDPGNVLGSLEEVVRHAQVSGYTYPIPPQQPATQYPGDKLLIASFNIQVFGESKLAKPEVVNVLTQVVRQFDIVAIQEIRAQADDILPRFVAAINADGSQYSYLIGPRLGRTSSTEQYAFVYNTMRVEVDTSSVGTMPDPQDYFHREPFMARFRPRTNSPDYAFSFWLVNIHTDPDEASQEVAALADVFQAVQRARPDEDDVILLGDLNASEKQLGRLAQLPGIYCVVSGVMTNTRQNEAYDNIIVDSRTTHEFTGRWGVFNLEGAFRLAQDQALQISDHFPVWAEFNIWEAPHTTNVADRIPSLSR